MYQPKIAFMFLLTQLCQGIFEREFILTPNLGQKEFGRTVLYDFSNKTIGITPWEQTLKHVTFLTLFNEGLNKTNLSNSKEYEHFMQAPYIRIQSEYPKFGDIITMAHGRLEQGIGYNFLEGKCEQYCSERVVALWKVQKIRHRDSQRGFRYEIKFSITPWKSETAKSSKSFILKDDDYPVNFNAITRRSDDFENTFNERLSKIVNEKSRADGKLLSNFPSLNIGEYFYNVPKASSKVGYVLNPHPDYVTTYRPDYHVRFPKPDIPETSNEPKTLVTHHYHHHYFMKDPEIQFHNQPHVFDGKLDAIRIVEGPSDKILPRYTKNMQQMPPFVQAIRPEETLQRIVDSKPFKKSEQQVEEIRYSEPDPLSIDDEQLNSQWEMPHTQVEQPSLRIPKIPDPINAQLSSPLEDQSHHMPLVNNKEEFASPTTITSFVTTLQHIKPPFASTTSNPKPSNIQLAYKIRNYTRTTTEQPVLKWKPKRKTKEKPCCEEEVNSVPRTSSEENIITITPSKIDVDLVEVFTQKSISKSISVRVGNCTEEIPFQDSKTESTTVMPY